MARLLMLGMLVFAASVDVGGQEPRAEPTTTGRAAEDAAANGPPEPFEALLQALREAVAAADELSRSAASTENSSVEEQTPRDPFSATPAMRRLAVQTGAAQAGTGQGPAQPARIVLPRVRGIAVGQASSAAALLEFDNEQIFVREGERFRFPSSGGGIDVVVEQIASGVTLQIDGQQHWIPVR